MKKIVCVLPVLASAAGEQTLAYEDPAGRILYKAEGSAPQVVSARNGDGMSLSRNASS